MYYGPEYRKKADYSKWSNTFFSLCRVSLHIVNTVGLNKTYEAIAECSNASVITEIVTMA